MPIAIENESQLQKSAVHPARTVNLDLYPSESDTDSGCDGSVDCCCAKCGDESSSLFGAAACVMVGASAHANEKSARRRLGAQALHWGVLFVGALFSIPLLVPTLSEPTLDWLNQNVLSSPGNRVAWVASLLASTLFAVGFVNRLGRERVLGGCAMLHRLGPAAVLGVAWSTLPSFAGVMLVLNMEPIRLVLVGDGASTLHTMLGMGIYLIGFVLLAGFGMLPTISQAILAGYAFGVAPGLILAMLGFGGASLLGYAIVGRIARNRVEHEIANKPRAKLLRDALLHASTPRALLIVSLVRLSPAAPFALTNLLLSSLGVNRWVFFFATLIGMLPRTLAAVLIGQQFTGWNGGIDKPRWLVIAGIVSLVALLVVISKVAAGALIRVTRQAPLHEAPAHAPASA